MLSSLTFQSTILKLQQFWADQGCIIWQPYHTEVGAGTMNPATFLRVLGPEPWWVAYVEPTIRPSDGRYGENPNRWQHFYQFQVILKPDPGDPQELYLRSLVQLGIEPERHDIRFVEDNWEAPALGAWGLGWEVWLDGQEITQFTYFQQAGGQVLDPVSVEITYGIERIVMILQGVDSFLDIHWNENHTYGEIALDSEVQFNRYNFETADVERLRHLYDEFEAEAKSSIEHDLVIPAHDYVLKCSHTFNILDARGAVGVAERAALFARMRDLAREVADAYLNQRREAGYPWKAHHPAYTYSLPEPTVEESLPTGKEETLLVEIGTEELPSNDLSAAIAQLEEMVAPMLSKSRLEHGPIQIMGTPRRLVILVQDLAPMQTEQIGLLKGPPAAKAFDDQGQPTSAAKGFARSNNLAVEALQIQEIDGGSYVVAEVREEGLPAEEVLQEEIPELFSKLRFNKTMRWNDSGVAFSRPIRWLLGLHGKRSIPFSIAGLTASRFTKLLRFQDPEWIEVSDARMYLREMKNAGIIIDPIERKQTILDQIHKLAGELNATIPEDQALENEVANLVEQPTALLGRFTEKDLELPRQVLITVMQHHQRSFPLEKDGVLLPYFVVVRNGAENNIDVVKEGNEQVIRARFADAAYFFSKDSEKPLESYRAQINTLTFQEQLGSVLDKVERLEKLVTDLVQIVDYDKDVLQTAKRAAHLCKADLVTLMVIEMTSLQGAMGREYALASGEKEAVANAIYEHYLPRFSGDQVPPSRPGLIVGMADRLDSLIGLFAAGVRPSGTRDPYALRRTAIGLVQSLISHELSFDIRAGLTKAAEYLPIMLDDNTIEDCLAFITSRQQALLLAEGKRHDIVEAVLAEQSHNPAPASRAVDELTDVVAKDNWDAILQAYARCARITRGELKQHAVNEEILEETAEKELLKALEKGRSQKRIAGSVNGFIELFEPMVPAITKFFDEVLVMEEDEDLRINRLAILQRIVELANGVADFSLLEGF